MKIGDSEYSKKELYARCGNLSQAGGVKRYEMSEGFEKGTEIIEIDSGAGLKCLISPSKGIDIVSAEYCGTNLNWSSPNRFVHPAYYQPAGTGWLHSYSSGLLTTCGFSNVGSACEDKGIEYGIHGKAHNTPAVEVTATTEWEGDECFVVVTGIVQEREMFGVDIALKRKITVQLGKNRIEVADTVENCGFEKVPVLLLYHCNFGFPLLTENSEIQIPSNRVEPRETNLDPVPAVWQNPIVNKKEQVYFHSEIISKSNIASAVISNPKFPVGTKTESLRLNMSWDTTNLPELIEWYMPGCTTHALGIEPANCRVMGRAIEKEEKRLVYFEPGEKKDYSLSFAINIDK